MSKKIDPRYQIAMTKMLAGTKVRLTPEGKDSFGDDAWPKKVISGWWSIVSIHCDGRVTLLHDDHYKVSNVDFDEIAWN
jgi:hypothetical protein